MPRLTSVEEKLASYFQGMYEYLLEEGVPEDRLPQPWHMLSRIVKCIDHDLLKEWLDSYVAVEAEEPGSEDTEDVDPDDEQEGPKPRPKPNRRPNYLRALQTDANDGEEGQEDTV